MREKEREKKERHLFFNTHAHFGALYRVRFERLHSMMKSTLWRIVVHKGGGLPQVGNPNLVEMYVSEWLSGSIFAEASCARIARKINFQSIMTLNMSFSEACWPMGMSTYDRKAL